MSIVNTSANESFKGIDIGTIGGYSIDEVLDKMKEKGIGESSSSGGNNDPYRIITEWGCIKTLYPNNNFNAITSFIVHSTTPQWKTTIDTDFTLEANNGYAKRIKIGRSISGAGTFPSSQTRFTLTINNKTWTYESSSSQTIIYQPGYLIYQLPEITTFGKVEGHLKAEEWITWMNNISDGATGNVYNSYLSYTLMTDTYNG